MHTLAQMNRRCPAVAFLWSPHRHASSSSTRSLAEEQGYYKLTSPSAVPPIDASLYTVHTARGSGPGGQGTNSSSNKVELRVTSEDLLLYLMENFPEEVEVEVRDGEDDDEDDDSVGGAESASLGFERGGGEKPRVRHMTEGERMHANVLRQGRGKFVASDGSSLLFTSHEHRSVLQNKEACLARLREAVRKASWVPPPLSASLPNPIDMKPTHRISAFKQDRRKKSNKRRMTRSARQGQW